MLSCPYRRHMHVSDSDMIVDSPLASPQVCPFATPPRLVRFPCILCVVFCKVGTQWYRRTTACGVVASNACACAYGEVFVSQLVTLAGTTLAMGCTAVLFVTCLLQCRNVYVSSPHEPCYAP